MILWAVTSGKASAFTEGPRGPTYQDKMAEGGTLGAGVWGNQGGPDRLEFIQTQMVCVEVGLGG